MSKWKILLNCFIRKLVNAGKKTVKWGKGQEKLFKWIHREKEGEKNEKSLIDL